MKLSFLLLIAWLWASVAGAAVAPQVMISLRPNNYVDSPTGVISTAGTTTSGIQEAINSVQRSTNLFVGPAGGSMINQGAGMYNYSSQITMPNTALRPFNITFQGAGWLNTIWRHIGTTAFDGIVSSYNPSFGSTNTLTVTFNDIGFTASSNFVMYIMNLGGVSYAHFNRCMFAPDAALTYNPAGWTANIHENGLTNVQGVAGVRLQSAQNPGVFFTECVFLGLASGVRSAMDNVQFTRCVAVDVGGYYNGSSFVFTNLWTTKPECLGGAFIDEGSSGDFYITDGQVGNCGAVIVEASSGAGLEGHLPKIKGGYFGDNQYTVLTYGLRPVMLESVFEGTTGGDSLVTNNAAGRAFPAQVRPNNVHRFNFVGNNISVGTNNNVKFTTRGDGTNWGRFSALNGAAVFDGTITTTSNLWVGRGGTASVNKLYTQTNPAVAGASTVSWWTNAASGGYIVDDSGFSGYNQSDSTEIYDKNGNSLYSSSVGIIDSSSIETMGFTPTGGAAGNPEILYFTYSDALSSPKAILPQVISTNTITATNGFASIATTSAASLTATGWTNSFGINATAYVTSVAVAFTVKNRANATIYTSPVLTATVPVSLQPGWSVNAASGLSGTALPQ